MGYPVFFKKKMGNNLIIFVIFDTKKWQFTFGKIAKRIYFIYFLLAR